jgi:Ca-activated chloride channel family protein
MMLTWLHEHFRTPWLLPAVALGVPVWFLVRQRSGRVIYSSLAALPPAEHGLRARLSWLPDLGLALAAALFGLVLAGPRSLHHDTQLHGREGIGIAMVVDTSGSMAALDLSDGKRWLAPSGSEADPAVGQGSLDRLEVVKQVFKDFVKDRPDDAIGLVSFARYADLRAPLTLDHEMLTDVLAGLHIVTDRREDGTAVGDGLALAVNHLRDAKAQSRVAILLTDGVSNAGDTTPAAAAELAASEHIKVYTIGAGTNGFAPMPVEDPFTGQRVLRGVPVEIDETTLQQIADKTGGRYFRATDGEALRRIYGEIDRLERTQLDDEQATRPEQHFVPPLAAALLLVALSWLGRGTLFRRLP